MSVAGTAERDRVRALRALAVLDQPIDERFDKITRIAQQVFDVPLVSLTLVDATRQWRASWSGPLDREASLDGAICSIAMHSTETFVRTDLLDDPAFADNPFVVGEPRLRFYAGAPLHAPGGEPIGTLCVMDTQPHSISARQISALADLGEWAERELSRATEHQQVAHIQRRLLPQRPPAVPGYACAGLYSPAQGVVGSDFYDWYPTPEGLQVTLVNVLSAGLAAALVAATARAALRSTALTADPAEHLNAAGGLLTSDLGELGVDIALFLGRIEATSGRLSFVEAGAWSILLARADGTWEWLHRESPPLAAAVTPFSTRIVELRPGDTLVCSSADPTTDCPGGTEDRGASLAAAVTGVSMAEIEDLIATVELSRRGTEDLTAVVLRRL